MSSRTDLLATCFPEIFSDTDRVLVRLILSQVYFKIIQLQVHFPTNDIPAPAPITMTRQSHERNFLVPYARIDAYKYSFFPNTISLWNKLPETIKEIQSLDTFKSRI